MAKYQVLSCLLLVALVAQPSHATLRVSEVRAAQQVLSAAASTASEHDPVDTPSRALVVYRDPMRSSALRARAGSASDHAAALRVEPITMTAIAVAVGTGIAATAIWEGAKWALSSDGPKEIKVHEAKPVNTIADTPVDNSFFQFCKKTRITATSAASQTRTWKLFDKRVLSDRTVEMKFTAKLDNAYIYDCTDEETIKSKYTQELTDAAFRKYIVGFEMDFKPQGPSQDTTAYMALRVALPAEALDSASTSDRQNWAMNPSLVPYVEVWEAGKITGDEKGTLWRFFYHILDGKLRYYGHKKSDEFHAYESMTSTSHLAGKVRNTYGASGSI